jgi:murein DD-endopeptidase MepM/ murein hydrolase activator NlpD
MMKLGTPGWEAVAWAAAGGFLAGAITIAVFMQRPGRPAQAARIETRPASLERPPPVERPTASAEPATPRIGLDPVEDLRGRHLTLPVRGVQGRELYDSFNETRAGGRHEAIDILAPRNTPVIAAEDGMVARLFTSKAGGLTIYQFDPTSTYCYYYAHLERYASNLEEGLEVRRGEVIGYVGTSGNAPQNTPHLHFAIFKLTDKKQWWQGTPIDPYAVLHD